MNRYTCMHRKWNSVCNKTNEVPRIAMAEDEVISKMLKYGSMIKQGTSYVQPLYTGTKNNTNIVEQCDNCLIALKRETKETGEKCRPTV